MLLELVEVDLDALIIEAFLLERDHRLERVRRGLGMVVTEGHHLLSI
jgi:hypothetical protein